MPIVNVNSIKIMYEAFGKGQTVFYLQSPWGGRNPGAYYLAGRLSSYYRTIIWDSPNTGQSDFIIKDTPSEWHQCCEYIHGLCTELGETQVYFAGCSGGGELALLLAHLYPELVKGIIMYRPVDTTSAVEKEIIYARYYALANIAENGTMKDVLEYSSKPPKTKWGHISKWVYYLARDKNTKKQLVNYDPALFATILRKWGDWMSNEGFYKANLSDNIIKSIKIPILINPAPDPFHSEKIARDLCNKLPNSIWAPSTSTRTEKEMYNGIGEEHHFGAFTELLPHIEVFLKQQCNE